MINYMPGCWNAPWDDDMEPIIHDLDDGKYLCETDHCGANAVAELSWPLEDHDFPCGFFCQQCLDALLDGKEPAALHSNVAEEESR